MLADRIEGRRFSNRQHLAERRGSEMITDRD